MAVPHAYLTTERTQPAQTGAVEDQNCGGYVATGLWSLADMGGECRL